MSAFTAKYLADVATYELANFYAGIRAERLAEDARVQERAGSTPGATVGKVATSDDRPVLPAATPNTDPIGSKSVSGYPPECYGHVVAPAIVMRESGCSYTAFNATGCSGRGCVGLYQLDEGHFYAVSPWNSSTSGVCYGLSYSPADQDECASRLGAGAWAN